MNIAPLTWIYDKGWKLAAPHLKRNKRLADGFEERMLEHPLPPAEIWIQAASGGEAYLAVELANAVARLRPATVLVTTNTRQGQDVLDNARTEKGLTLHAAFCPFDRPSLMRKALAQVAPKCVVLLETELWPGLLKACKDAGTHVAVVNGRMSPKSFPHYLALSGILKELGPDSILAMSEADAMRYGSVFGHDRVSVMHNIKFDRVAEVPEIPFTKNPAASVLRPAAPFVVLGSVREEEEPQVLDAIKILLQKRPKTVIGLFPRHMHRTAPWTALLAEADVPHVLRSETDSPVAPGTVIVWDTFGELGAAYNLARAAFVGGSLAPLGGQNFLEAASAGVVPVLGPHWKNFAWAGQEFFDEGLATQVADGVALGEALADMLNNPKPKEAIRRKFADYVNSRKGGTKTAARHVASLLNA